MHWINLLSKQEKAASDPWNQNDAQGYNNDALRVVSQRERPM